MVTEFLTEIETALQAELNVVSGYEEILSFPDALLSSESRRETEEAVRWSYHRRDLLLVAVAAVEDLIIDSYPAREVQLAPASVIAELEDRLAKMKLAVDQFNEPITVTATVSDEIPVT